jgi:hypothetical protein
VLKIEHRLPCENFSRGRRFLLSGRLAAASIFVITQPAAFSSLPMMIDLLLAAAAVVLLVPLLTGYAAYSHGRGFWLWFTLGLVLPIVSLALLTVLIAVRQFDPGQRLVDDARRILAEDEEREARRRVASNEY